MKRRGALLTGFFFLAAQPCLGAAPPPNGLPFDQPHGARDCSGIPARIDVMPAAGRALRGAPNDRAAIVGRLGPARARHGGGAVRPSLPLIQSFDGYLLVRGASRRGDDAWLLARGVSTGASATRGYSFPDVASTVVIRTRGHDRLDAHAELIDIIACDHDWIFGRWRIDAPARVSFRREIAIWSDPPVVEFWTPACDRRSHGCDTPPGRRSHRRGPRDPFPGSGEE